MTTTAYPPAHHLLTDLGMEAEVVSEAEAHVRTEVTPHVVGPDGGVRAGVLATLVDVVGGSVALRAVGPEWMATADLVVERVRPALGPRIEARATLRRRGRTTLVVEALVFELATVATNPNPVAWATMTFALRPKETDVAAGADGPSVDVPPEFPSTWAFTGDGFDHPVLESLGVEVVDAPAGRLSMPVLPYHRNSFGAVQGGAMALLAEAAAEKAIAAATPLDAGPVAVSGLQVAYLALGRDGPITSRATVLDSAPRSVAGAVVELADASSGRVTTVVNVSAVAG